MSLYPLLVAIASVVWCGAGASKVTLGNGGYKGLLVSFSGDIDEAKREDVLRQAEALFDNASDVLFTATHNRFTFEEVTFLLPETWQVNISQTNLISERHGYADVWVTKGQDLFGGNPYTIQHRGCGQPAQRIFLPEDFLTSDQDISGKAKAFVHEWAHYRYGVFDENGYPDDPRFPLYYGIRGRENVAATSCTNEQITYKPQKTSGTGTCQPKVDRETGLPISSDCNLVPNVTNGVVSSLMYKDVLQKVSHFCDGDKYPHNSEAPNKHNTFCNGQSTWSVITRHPDFASDIRVEKKKVTFKYVQERMPHVVVALDGTKRMKDESLIIVAAIKEFFLGDFPSEGKVGFLVYDEKVTEVSTSLTNPDVSYTDIRGYLRFTVEQACLTCASQAVSRGVKLLESDEQKAAGETVVLITSEALSPDNIANISATLQNRNIRLVIVFYQQNSTINFNNPSFNRPWKFHVVPEDYSSTPPPKYSLYYGAFTSVLEGYTWGMRKQALVVSRGYRALNGEVHASFDIDSSLSTMDFVVAGKDINGNILFISSCVKHNGSCVDLRGISKNGNPAVAKLNFKKPQGSWNATIKLREDYQNHVTLMVLGTAEDSSTISVRSSMNTSTQWVDLNDPLVLYAEVKKGIYPVANANVTAVFYHYQSEKNITFQLLDNGLGDPDVTKNDGIYSRYVTGLEDTGFYLYTIVVDDNNQMAETSSEPVQGNAPSGTLYNGARCCGSFIPITNPEKTGKFRRKTYASTIYVTNVAQPGVYPPNQILDLKLLSGGEDNKIVLQWTAPGNDYDSGTAARYELRSFEDLKYVTSHFSNGKEEPITVRPLQYGTPQDISLSIEPAEESRFYYFAIRAEDESRANGRVSNVVGMWYEAPPPTTTETNAPTSFPDTTGKTGYPEKQRDKKPLDSAKIGIIVGVSIASFIVLIVAVVLIIIFCTRRRRNEKRSASKSPNSSLKPNPGNSQNGPANDDLRTKNYWSVSELIDSGRRIRNTTEENGRPPTLSSGNRVSVASTMSVKDSISREEFYPVSLEENSVWNGTDNRAYNETNGEVKRRATAV